MNHNRIKPNKNIFTAYVGLIASGYDLSEGSCDGEILKLIKKQNMMKISFIILGKPELNHVKLILIGQELFYYHCRAYI